MGSTATVANTAAQTATSGSSAQKKKQKPNRNNQPHCPKMTLDERSTAADEELVAMKRAMKKQPFR